MIYQYVNRRKLIFQNLYISYISLFHIIEGNMNVGNKESQRNVENKTYKSKETLNEIKGTHLMILVKIGL
jgi:hypothetical protein